MNYYYIILYYIHRFVADPSAVHAGPPHQHGGGGAFCGEPEGNTGYQAAGKPVSIVITSLVISHLPLFCIPFCF